MPASNDIKKAFNDLREQAALQEKVNESIESYFETVKKIGRYQANIKHLTKSVAELRNKVNNASSETLEADQKALKIAEKTLNTLKEQNKQAVEAVKNANKLLLSTRITGKVIVATHNGIKDAWGKIKGSGLFEMDKAVKTTALSMGLVSSQAKDLSKNIFDSATGVGKLGDSTINLGVGMQELAKMQSGYSDSIGRTVSFTNSGNIAMAELASGTMLGSEGAASMAASMDAIGKGAEATRDFIESSVNNAHKAGINSNKVIKNIRENINLLNRYNFKEGSKGLKDMAISAAKMQTSMQLALPMADKLFNIEGAVEMSAQLQVLGGKWAALADPFKLMYMARNDVKALNTAIIDATSSTAVFNKETKEFDIAPLEMQRLRAVAQATGLDFEQLAVSAKKAATFSRINSQIKISADDTTKEYIQSIASLDKNGNATVHIKGEVGEKLVSALSSNEIQSLKTAAIEKETLNERAKSAQTFDDALNNTLNLFKTAMLPIVEQLNTTLIPFVQRIFDDDDFKNKLVSLGSDIGKFVGGAASILKSASSLAFELGPKGTLLTIIGGNLLFNTGKWLINGISLGQGFMSVAKAGMVGNSTGSSALGSGLGKRLGWGVGLGAAGMATQMATDLLAPDKKSTGNKVGSVISSGLEGAALGSMILPGWGTGIGGALGVIYGAVKAASQGDEVNDIQVGSPISDGIFNSKNKTNYTKGRGLIENGRITPIDNKDELIAAKPGGVFDKGMNNSLPSSLDINFGDIKINGNIVLKTEGNNGVDITDELLKNSEFVRNITKMVHVETSKALNGGKISGQPTL